MLERKKILSQIDIDTEMFFTSFDEAARLLLENKAILEKQGWSSIHLKMEYYNDYAELCVFGVRLENDFEFNERKELEERTIKAAQKKEERERKKYEQLKQRYEQ